MKKKLILSRSLELEEKNRIKEDLSGKIDFELKKSDDINITTINLGKLQFVLKFLALSSLHRYL